MYEVLRLLSLHVACTLTAVFYGYVYARLSILPSLSNSDESLFTQWLVWALILSMLALTPPLLKALFPVGRALQVLRQGGTPTPGVLQLAQQRSLNLPVIQTRLSTIAWFASALSLPVYLNIVRPEFDFILMAHGVVITMLIGAVASTSLFYLIEWHVRVRVIPKLVPDGRVFDLPGVTVTPIGFKILMLLVLVCVVPVAVLTLAAWTDTASPEAVIYLGASFIVFGAIQGTLIAGSVTQPIRRIAALMERVGKNDIEARAAVVSTDEIGRLAAGFNQMTAGLREAAFVKDTFGRYVTDSVRDEILSGNITLGGELREATILFSDIRDFTSLSEAQSPQEVVAFLNRYLDTMVNIIVEEGGTIDKFIGDAILASFGVPVVREGDAQRAVRAGVRMVAALEEMNVARARGGLPPIRIGIGIHTGQVLAGNIGSARRMEYTVIGDAVNTASRIEQVNKQLGTTLLVSAATRKAAGEMPPARALDPLLLKGKQESVQLYEILVEPETESFS